MIYLASPYSDKDPDVMAARAYEAEAAAAHFAREGFKLYCPIAAWHGVSLRHDLPKSWEDWRGPDFEILRHASEFWVLKIDGWRNSVGVQAELVLANHLNMRIIGIEKTPVGGYARVNL